MNPSVKQVRRILRKHPETGCAGLFAWEYRFCLDTEAQSCHPNGKFEEKAVC